jgi:hypothetical protein
VPSAQSPSALQVFAHAPAEQTKGAQALVVDVHVPPLHVPPCFRVAASWQVACEQLVPSTYFWQPLEPLHLPFVPHVVGPWSTHEPSGSTEPAAMAAHVPWPLTLQAWQFPHVGVLQQTSSTQLPLMHWPPALQSLPFASLGTHVPPTAVQ